jgi:hypothetical protein
MAKGTEAGGERKKSFIWIWRLEVQGYHEMATHLIRPIDGDPRPNALFQASRAPAHQTIPLKCIIILNVLCELGKRIARG